MVRKILSKVISSSSGVPWIGHAWKQAWVAKATVLAGSFLVLHQERSMQNRNFLWIVVLSFTLISFVAIKIDKLHGQSTILPVESTSPTSSPTSKMGCSRSKEYPYPEEFKRATSLLRQRLKDSDADWASQFIEAFDLTRNCLDIQYALSEEEMNGAEGMFMFSADSTPNRLEIFVSPRYKVKDDLLTAVLLSHEITHALIFANGQSESTTCFENEAQAFMTEMVFLSTLNDDEIASITYRSNNGYSEARGVTDLITNVRQMDGSNSYEKMLNYVKSNEFYQSQCGFEK